MRHLTLLAVLAGSMLIPVAYAQAQGAAYDTRYAANPGANPPGARPTTSENCGTPDEPKACPPLPRHNLAVTRVIGLGSGEAQTSEADARSSSGPKPV